MSMSQPSARRAARSAIVAFDPGRTIRSASPGSACPGGTNSYRDIRLGDQRIEIVEVGDARQPRDGDADRLPGRSPLTFPDLERLRPRPAGARAPSNHGTTPKLGRPCAR